MNTLRIFLCHCSADKPAVRDLYRQLRGDGFEPWLDEDCILPGEDWDEAIRDAFRTADVVVVCLSRQAITREGYVQREIRLALQLAEEKPPGAIFMIPARLENCDVPKHLARWQWVDLFSQRGYERLRRSLRKRQGWLESQSDAVFRLLSRHPLANYNGASERKFMSWEDGSDFGRDLTHLMQGVMEHSKGQAAVPSVCVIVRGKSFTDDRGLGVVYDDALGTLFRRGIVLATSFACWETWGTEVSDILPFAHVHRNFRENFAVSVTAPPGSPARAIIGPNFEIINSYEILTPKPDAVVALWQQTDIPLLGCRRFGQGLCIYFNACQHACEGGMESPLSAFPSLREAVAVSLERMIADHLTAIADFKKHERH